jgi:hypothetical protein
VLVIRTGISLKSNVYRFPHNQHFALELKNITTATIVLAACAGLLNAPKVSRNPEFSDFIHDVGIIKFVNVYQRGPSDMHSFLCLLELANKMSLTWQHCRKPVIMERNSG